MKIDVNRLELAMRYRGLSNKEAASAAGMSNPYIVREIARQQHLLEQARKRGNHD